MGNIQYNELSTLLKQNPDLTILLENKQRNHSILKHQKSQQEYLSVLVTAQSKLDSNNVESKMIYKLSNPSQYIEALEKTHKLKSSFFSNEQKYIMLFRKPKRSIFQQIQERRSKNMSFSDDQIELILDNTLKAIKDLKNIEHYHSNINSGHLIINQNREVKLSDPWMGSPQFYLNQTRITNYVSPEQLQFSYSRQNKDSNLFSLGMVALEVYYLQPQTDIYLNEQKDGSKLINLNKLNQCVSRVVNPSIRKYISILTSIDPKRRNDIYEFLGNYKLNDKAQLGLNQFSTNTNTYKMYHNQAIQEHPNFTIKPKLRQQYQPSINNNIIPIHIKVDKNKIINQNINSTKIPNSFPLNNRVIQKNSINPNYNPQIYVKIKTENTPSNLHKTVINSTTNFFKKNLQKTPVFNSVPFSQIKIPNDAIFKKLIFNKQIPKKQPYLYEKIQPNGIKINSNIAFAKDNPPRQQFHQKITISLNNNQNSIKNNIPIQKTQNIYPRRNFENTHKFKDLNEIAQKTDQNLGVNNQIQSPITETVIHSSHQQNREYDFPINNQTNEQNNEKDINKREEQKQQSNDKDIQKMIESQKQQINELIQICKEKAEDIAKTIKTQQCEQQVNIWGSDENDINSTFKLKQTDKQRFSEQLRAHLNQIEQKKRNQKKQQITLSNAQPNISNCFLTPASFYQLVRPYHYGKTQKKLSNQKTNQIDKIKDQKKQLIQISDELEGGQNTSSNQEYIQKMLSDKYQGQKIIILQQLQGQDTQQIQNNQNIFKNVLIQPIAIVDEINFDTDSEKQKQKHLEEILEEQDDSSAKSEANDIVHDLSQFKQTYNSMSPICPPSTETIQKTLKRSPQKHMLNSQNNNEEYVIQEYEVGSKYQGQKSNGMRNGWGKFYYQQGSLYDGEWKDNKMHGYGKLYYSNGQLAYEGDWYQDQFHGQGKVYNDSPILEAGTFDYRNFNLVEQQWDYYEGGLVSDAKQGLGKIRLENGQVFIGMFFGDKLNGEGRFYCLDGTVVHGIWKDSVLIEQLSQ